MSKPPLVITVPSEPRFVSRKTLAARYEMSERTISRWTDSGVLPYNAAPGNIRRYDLQLCDEIFAAWSRRGLVPSGRAA
jgi:DNA-binding transcriptional MerR regulator